MPRYLESNFAPHVLSIHYMAASITSGSFRVNGMVAIPCSVKTPVAINAGYCDGIISRTAEVVFTKCHQLVPVTQDCLLRGIRLHDMLSLTQHYAIASSPVPAVYIRPLSVDDLVDHTVMRVLNLFDLNTDVFSRWYGSPNS